MAISDRPIAETNDRLDCDRQRGHPLLQLGRLGKRGDMFGFVGVARDWCLDSNCHFRIFETGVTNYGTVTCDG